MDFILREIANNTLDTGFNDQLLEAADYINSLEQRLAKAEELKADFKKAMKLFEDTGLDNLLWTLLDTITKEE